MATYKCNVYDDRGRQKKIKMVAEDEVELKVLLSKQGLFLVNYKQIADKEFSSFFTFSFSVKRPEVVTFLRQYSVMINSGISVEDTLNTLRLQNYTKGFKEVLDKIHADIISGELLSAAFRFHPTVFPDFFCNMVEIGELSGSLDVVLKSMADYYENDERLKKKAKSSLAYPTVLMVLIVAVVLFMTYFILPQFQSMFEEFGGDIPTITTIVFSVAQFIRDYIFLMLGIAVALFLILFLFFKTAPGKHVKDWLSLHIPVLGSVNNAVITARFSRAFTILLKSGMNITGCMDNLVNILGNSIYTDKFKVAIEEIKKGRTIAKSLSNTDTFNPMLVQMISVGEKSGNLEEVLESTTSFFDDQVSTKISKAISLLEPITIIVLGTIVALVLLSVYIPMIDLMNKI